MIGRGDIIELDDNLVTLEYELGREERFYTELSEFILSKERMIELGQIIVYAIAEYEQETGTQAPDPLPVMFKPDKRPVNDSQIYRFMWGG